MKTNNIYRAHRTIYRRIAAWLDRHETVCTVVAYTLAGVLMLAGIVRMLDSL
ncbi:MAG: hypothetical protein HUK06_01515 [Bacteroidaceae bacterium]|nr:hypothetical protein [Bacteroidaceae bacterium]